MKLSQDEFILRAIEKHGNKYDYSLVEYKNMKNRVRIVCEEHGEFLQNPQKHIRGSGCTKCFTEGRRSTLDYFIQKSNKIHNNFYDYSKVNYTNDRTIVDILCYEHGIFSQLPNAHLRGCGCPKCGLLKKSINRKNNINDLIFSFIEKHGDKYDYSKIEYVKMRNKVLIRCNTHNIEFLQSPMKHLDSKTGGCPKCCNNIGKGTLDKDLFIEKANKIHKNKYSYDLVEYKKSNKKIKIICPEHSIFEMVPNSHLGGRGCQKCAGNYRYSIYELKDIFNKIHNNKYEYDFSNFINIRSLIKVKCPIHSYFNISSYSHKNGYGCSSCGKFSNGEELVSRYLKEKEIKYEKQKSFNGCVYVNKIQFDFYLPDRNICIEYDGIQHFEPVEYFGGNESFRLQKTKDKIKNDYCIKNNIELIRIPYYEIKNINKILECSL